MRNISNLIGCAGIVFALVGCGGEGAGSNTAGGAGGGAAVSDGCQIGAAPCSSQVPPELSTMRQIVGTPDDYAGQCTPDPERKWVRAHLDDVYLWYDKIVESPMAALYAQPADYFNTLLVRSEDRFSFSSPIVTIDNYFQNSQSTGYGADFVLVEGRLRIAYVEPGSPAASLGVVRGTEILGINDKPLSQIDRNTRNAALFPDGTGASNRFVMLDPGASMPRDVTLVSADIIRRPVLDSRILNADDGRKVGYLALTEHVAAAEAPLIAAMNDFKNAGIDDLVLDMRYNGGGYLYIADELAGMIGSSAMTGKVFEKLIFNDKHPEKTNSSAYKLSFPFFSETLSMLPHLNLERVFVLTTIDTCSASESVINSLLPYMQVIRIGTTTCGKPYGMIQTNNCGTAYFAIQFRGVNSAGQADYANGFTPTCTAEDDLDHQLGDPDEGLLHTALSYRSGNSCPVAGAFSARSTAREAAPAPHPYRPPWQTNGVLLPAR